MGGRYAVAYRSGAIPSVGSGLSSAGAPGIAKAFEIPAERALARMMAIGDVAVARHLPWLPVGLAALELLPYLLPGGQNVYASGFGYIPGYETRCSTGPLQYGPVNFAYVHDCHAVDSRYPVPDTEFTAAAAIWTHLGPDPNPLGWHYTARVDARLPDTVGAMPYVKPVFPVLSPFPYVSPLQNGLPDLNTWPLEVPYADPWLRPLFAPEVAPAPLPRPAFDPITDPLAPIRPGVYPYPPPAARPGLSGGIPPIDVFPPLGPRPQTKKQLAEKITWRAGREKKPKGDSSGVSGYPSIMGPVGIVTEAVDLLEAIWEAIPDRVCRENEGPNARTGPEGYGMPWAAGQGGGLLGGQGGNVSQCTGPKIKGRKTGVKPVRYKDANGNWQTRRATDDKGIPLKPTPDVMAKDIYNNWGYIDFKSAIDNIVANEVKDQVLGRTASWAQQAYQKNITGGLNRGRFGFAVGPAL